MGNIVSENYSYMKFRHPLKKSTSTLNIFGEYCEKDIKFLFLLSETLKKRFKISQIASRWNVDEIEEEQKECMVWLCLLSY